MAFGSLIFHIFVMVPFLPGRANVRAHPMLFSAPCWRLLQHSLTSFSLLGTWLREGAAGSGNQTSHPPLHSPEVPEITGIQSLGNSSQLQRVPSSSRTGGWKGRFCSRIYWKFGKWVQKGNCNNDGVKRPGEQNPSNIAAKLISQRHESRQFLVGMIASMEKTAQIV